MAAVIGYINDFLWVCWAALIGHVDDFWAWWTWPCNRYLQGSIWLGAQDRKEQGSLGLNGITVKCGWNDGAASIGKAAVTVRCYVDGGRVIVTRWIEGADMDGGAMLLEIDGVI